MPIDSSIETSIETSDSAGPTGPTGPTEQVGPVDASSAKDATPSEPSDDAAADWLLLDSTESLELYCASWLRIQSAWIGNVSRAVVCRHNNETPTLDILAAQSENDADALEGLIESTFREGTGLAGPTESTDGHVSVSHILMPADSPAVVVAVEVKVARQDQSELTQVLRQLQWGSAWLLRRLEAETSESELSGPASPAQARALLDVIALGLGASRFEEAAQAFVSQLARLLGCDRVSLGIEANGRTRVVAISHSAAFGREMNLVRAIESAMDEARDQNAIVLSPPPPDQAPLVVREHVALAREHGAHSVLSIPIHGDGTLEGAVTFEHRESHVFPAERIALLETMTLAIAPILELRRLEDRSLAAKIAEAGRLQLSRMVGPGHLKRKMIVTAIAALILFFAIARGEYRIAAEGTIEGMSRRVIIAPFDGYVAEAHRRAGDFVQKGELLATLDDRELELERLKWASRLVQLERQSDESRAAREYGRTSILVAQTDEARAELERLQDRLTRTRVIAPFKGLVVSGDLSQSLGAAIERGDALFEIAPLEQYRILLEVDEGQIGDVSLGQRGNLLLSALPSDGFEFEVTKVTPVANAADGRNFFRVEGLLDSQSPRLRPGMEGVGKISVEDRRLIWIWTRSFQNWLRLWVWSWWP